MEAPWWVAVGSLAFAAIAGVAAWFSWSEARRANLLSEAAALRYQPGWRIHRRPNNLFLLVNESPEIAFGVSVKASPWFVVEGSAEHAAVTSFSSVAFRLDTNQQADWDAMIVVTWHRRADASDDPMTWRHPVLWGLDGPS